MCSAQQCSVPQCSVPQCNVCAAVQCAAVQCAAVQCAALPTSSADIDPRSKHIFSSRFIAAFGLPAEGLVSSRFIAASGLPTEGLVSSLTASSRLGDPEGEDLEAAAAAAAASVIGAVTRSATLKRRPVTAASNILAVSMKRAAA